MKPMKQLEFETMNTNLQVYLTYLRRKLKKNH